MDEHDSTRFIDAQKPLMAGKRGLIMGVANNHSIAWGIARILSAYGAELAFTYQDDVFAKRVDPLAASLGSKRIFHCDVEDCHSIENSFAELKKDWQRIDFVVHAIAYSAREELKGYYMNTSRENFSRTMIISCFSFTEIVRIASPMMNEGGAFLTLTFGGSRRMMPNYNVMGLAKASLEASVVYLASDLGERNIRVNALSAGPVRTLAGAGVAGARALFRYQRENSPLKRAITLDEIGKSALYLTSDLSTGVTGEVHYVDCGYNTTFVPKSIAKNSNE